MQVERGVREISGVEDLRKLQQPPKEWITAAKEKLCKYLQQIDLAQETTPEWVNIHSFKKVTFKESEMGINTGRYVQVINYQESLYDGFKITLQVGAKTFDANVTVLGGGVEVHFPCFDDYLISVTRELMLNVIKGMGHQLKQEIDPKTVEVNKTYDTLSDSLIAFFGYTDQLETTKTFDLMVPTYEMDLRIGDYTYIMVVLRNGKLAKNVRCSKLGETRPVNIDFNPSLPSSSKKMAFTFERWVEAPSLNDGKPFELSKCPHKIVAKAKELIGVQNLKLHAEREMMLSFKQLGIQVQGHAPRVPGWHLQFKSDKSDHEVYIDAEGQNALVV
jgi:hypothetical protein